MKLKKHHILLLICIASLASCSLFRSRCKIDKCHILATHTHPYVFDGKKFRAAKRKKKRAHKMDSTSLASHDSTVSVTDSNHVEGDDHQKKKKKWCKKKKKEDNQDVLGPDGEVQASSKKGSKGKKNKNQEEEKVDRGWEDELWEDGEIEEDEEGEVDESEEEEESVDEDELIDAEKEQQDAEKALKKEVKATQKSRKLEERSSKKQAKAAKKAEKTLNRKWRSNVTPWWRWNQSPKIGEKWKRSKKK